jgi:Phage tail lysozyme
MIPMFEKLSGALSLEEIQAILDQKEPDEGPLVQIGTDGEFSLFTFDGELDPPQTAATLRKVDGATPPQLPGHVLRCHGNIFLSGALTHVAAYRAGQINLGAAGGDQSAARRAFDFFLSAQWSEAQAAGLIANIEAESSFRIDVPGDGGAAYGLCQWHPDRQAHFSTEFGKNIKGSTFDEQLQFVNFELRQGREQAAGVLLKGATTAQEAGEIVSAHYLRPDDPDSSKKTGRGARAAEWFNLFA